MCLFTCSVSTIVVANIAKSWTLHHALHAGHWLYCIFLTWSHSSWTGYYFVTSAMQILMFDLFWVKQFMLFSLFGNECYSQNELDGSTSCCYLLFLNLKCMKVIRFRFDNIQELQTPQYVFLTRATVCGSQQGTSYLALIAFWNKSYLVFNC